MLRLLADDLTGALDSTAPFAASRGPLPVLWDEAACRSGDTDVAFDSETRDAAAAPASARVADLAARLALTAGFPAFKKIDSCLRGQPASEIAAVVRSGGFRSTVVAAAFPRQGRVTRSGRQWLKVDGAWRDLGVDIAAELGRLGLVVEGRRRPTGAGVFVCDAEVDADLERIAACGAGLEAPTLWCGAGGLARALAGAGAMLLVDAVVRAPVLVLMGTGHAVTRAQLAALPPATSPAFRVQALALSPGAAAEAARVALERLVARAAAGPQPATLIVTGGETLMRLCVAVGAGRLCVLGELEPGVPVSTMSGGRWSGTTVVSKSGGFGDPLLLARLLAPALGHNRCGALP